MSSIPQQGNIADDVLPDEDKALHPRGAASAKISAENAEADVATIHEHGLSLKAAIKLYRKAIMFSLVFSLAVVMEGYDASLMGTFFCFKPFLDRYGDESNPEFPGRRIVSARWQTILIVGGQVGSLSRALGTSVRLIALTFTPQVGSIVGLYINGWTAERVGFKKAMLGSLTLMVASTFVPFFAQNLRDLLIGAIFQG
jgi:SP family general alpha glucoside:H+ symporter-like MFS transporter